MTIKEIYDNLTSTSLEVAYYQFPIDNAPELPFLVYYFPQSNDFMADAINYQKINSLNIELYTKEKEFDTEALVESALNSMGLTYKRTEAYLDDQRCYEVLFETEVLING